ETLLEGRIYPARLGLAGDSYVELGASHSRENHRRFNLNQTGALARFRDGVSVRSTRTIGVSTGQISFGEEDPRRTLGVEAELDVNMGGYAQLALDLERIGIETDDGLRVLGNGS